MSVFGEPRSFHEKFKFQIEVDNLGRAAFKSCSELTIDVGEIAYSEGGMIIPYKEPGRLTYSDLTLDRATTSDLKMHNWIMQIADAARHVGDPSPSFKRTATIVQYGRDGTRLREWNLSGCWPKKYTAGSWDNESDEFTMEQIVIAYDYFTPGTNVDPTATANSFFGTFLKAFGQ